MSQELIKIAAPKALALPAEERSAMMEAFAENVTAGALSEFDLPRIKVMTGAALWLLPGLEREETAQKIEGIILLKRDARVYYASKDTGNAPPNCSSTNSITGARHPRRRVREVFDSRRGTVRPMAAVARLASR